MSDYTHTDSKGRIWNRYLCSWTGPDGQYSFDIYAVSDEHAQIQLQDLKETAKVDGRYFGEVKAELE